jgi:hypothetical protein
MLIENYIKRDEELQTLFQSVSVQDLAKFKKNHTNQMNI